MKVKLEGLRDAAHAQTIYELVAKLPSVTRTDLNIEKGLLRVVTPEPLSIETVTERLRPYGVTATLLAPEIPPRAAGRNADRLECTVAIAGMHCRSCELTVERAFKKVPGVERVSVDATRGLARVIATGGHIPAVADLNATIQKDGYTVRRVSVGVPKREREDAPAPTTRPSFWQLVGLFALVLLLGSIFSRLGLIKPSIAVGSTVSFAAAFFIGLVAASSSCVAVAGGLLLGVAGKYRERAPNASAYERMKPVFFFVAGRVVGYGVLGGVIGAIGNALAPSPFVTGIITLFAAFVMLVMGLDMLHLAPGWLKRLLPRMPKSLAHRVMDAEGHPHPATPFLLGAGTFFLPCGFTQALQLYALTTGSALTGATILLAFAVGTAPALLALGFASNSLRGKMGQFFFRFSGALVIVLGLWNMQNGLSIAGYPLRLPQFSLPERAVAAQNGDVNDPNVRAVGGEQVVDIDVSYAGYSPERFTLSRNVPTRLKISGDAAGQGCLAAFQIPKFGIRELLKSDGTTEITFTPTQPGNYTFSCSMGMYRGTFTVL